MYSRGVPGEIYMEFSDNDMSSAFFDFVMKYVLFDDVIDWERDIHKGFVYNDRNTVLRCGNLRSFTQSKLP